MVRGRGFTVARPTVAHRAQHAHLVPGVREQAFQQIGAGGLAVGAGDAQNLDARRIRAPAGLGQTPEGLARIFMIDHAAAFGPDGRLKRGILRPAGAADHHGGPGLHGGAVEQDVPLCQIDAAGEEDARNVGIGGRKVRGQAGEDDVGTVPG